MDNADYKKPLFYQSANADDESIKENFLIRLHEYDIIIQDILRHPMKGAVQHYLLVGRRGSGKSTLLKRLQIEIASNAALKNKYIAINLAEEQANIYRFYDLLEEIVHELECHGISDTMPEWEDDLHRYTRKLLDHLHELVQKSGKKIVLLLDNIDRIFENIGDDANLLREYLLNHDDIRIIGGSTRMTEHFWKYNQPFYQFFRMLELKALTAEEVKCLLLSWSEKMNLPQIKKFVKTRPGQLETIRLLTDGLPRTLQFFVNVLLTNTQETGYEYLRFIMDSVTPLYQERLNTLPPAQRKIVLQMAFLWEAVGTGKLAEVAKMNNNIVSAQLKQLSEKGIVEKVESGNKNHLYRLTERFFNLWLIFTQGSPIEKRKAKYLTIFLENFYDAKQLQQLATEHLAALKNASIDADKAVLLTKAFAQSRHIGWGIRDALIIRTLQLKNISEEVKSLLPLTFKGIMDEVIVLISKNELDKALKIATGVEQNGFEEFIMGLIYWAGDKLDEAERAFVASAQDGFEIAVFFLGRLYEEKGNYTDAEKCYLKLKELENIEVYLRLGNVYLKNKKYTLAKKYFLRAVEADKELSVEIGEAYFDVRKFKEAEFFLDIGIKADVIGAATQLALVFYLQNINKQKALALLQKDRTGTYESSRGFKFVEILLNIWHGDFSNIRKDVISFAKDKTRGTDIVLEHLLYHGQFNLVHQLFEVSDIAAFLREHFLPLYYATLILSQPQEKIALKIPPEVQDTVHSMLQRVEGMAAYYKKEK